jgi:hypothetical protein
MNIFNAGKAVPAFPISYIARPQSCGRRCLKQTSPARRICLPGGYRYEVQVCGNPAGDSRQGRKMLSWVRCGGANLKRPA